MSDIKKIIKEHRQKANLTMKELAQKVGVSEATISRWESGNIASMRQSKIAALCEALDISPVLFVPGATTNSVEVKAKQNFLQHLYKDDPDRLKKLESVTFSGHFDIEDKLYSMPPSTQALVRNMINSALDQLEETGADSITITDKKE